MRLRLVIDLIRVAKLFL
ncbi:hypothetical protein F383_35953 [Gossypium arboreum]|uniref:Uncharacterized protein n=1 Tax=Gossypium arboreum TaxID=29729 RepID=A0A0B0N350_GOSAR|nr:hypothetical protein F383_35953 [Gossypium arboreum]